MQPTSALDARVLMVTALLMGVAAVVMFVYHRFMR